MDKRLGSKESITRVDMKNPETIDVSIVSGLLISKS